MDTFDFQITTDLDTLPSTLEFNFDTLKAALTERVARYNGLIVTPDSISSAKADRAALNKLRTALENERKEVKRNYLAPYNGFEAKAKELVAILERPIQAIDDQLATFEKQRVEARQLELQTYFDAQISERLPDWKDWIPLSAIWKAEWLNVSCPVKRAKQEISDAVSKIQADLVTLDLVEKKFRLAVQAKYLENFDISAALAEQKRLTQLDSHMQHLRAKGIPSTAKPEKEYRLVFECLCTIPQVNQLKQWFQSNTISHRRLAL